MPVSCIPPIYRDRQTGELIPAWKAPDLSRADEVLMDDPPAVPDGFKAVLAELPDAQSVLRYTIVPLNAEEQVAKREMLEAAIDAEFNRRLRERYSLDDELYFGRVGVGIALGTYQFQGDEQQQIADFQVFAENLREWKRAEKVKL